jgi:hypothetical protein
MPENWQYLTRATLFAGDKMAARMGHYKTRIKIPDTGAVGRPQGTWLSMYISFDIRVIQHRIS